MLNDLTFEQWQKYMFHHPEDDRDWWVDVDDDWWDCYANPALTLEYVTRLFENSESATAAYSDTQIAHGLWFIASAASSGHLHCLSDAKVTWAQRERGFHAMYTLFEQLFVKRCTPHLSHTHIKTTPSDVNPLNGICYMWWDVDWITGHPDQPAYTEIDNAALDVMERTLRLDSIACQEGALHGLGHWKFDYPDRVTSIIDSYLQREKALPHDLKQYALSARIGCVQ